MVTVVALGAVCSTQRQHHKSILRHQEFCIWSLERKEGEDYLSSDGTASACGRPRDYLSTPAQDCSDFYKLASALHRECNT